jgi:hypothetical protein
VTPRTGDEFGGVLSLAKPGKLPHIADGQGTRPDPFRGFESGNEMEVSPKLLRQREPVPGEERKLFLGESDGDDLSGGHDFPPSGSGSRVAR